MFMGGLLLLAAVIAWSTGFMMSPHGTAAGETGQHVRTTVAIFLRNSAVGTLILCALAGWLLFPKRRPRWPARDYAILGIIAILVASSIYDLVWLETAVLD
jgi:drug/metabolite transporter (DMT)-like permease